MTPTSPRLDVMIPDRFACAGDEPLEPTTDPWWRTVGGTELEELLVVGLAHNRELRAAHARIDAARWDSEFADAERWPELAATLSASEGERSTRSSFLGSETSRVSTDRFSLGVAMHWEADVFGRLRSGMRGALERLAAATEDRRALELLTARSIAYAWVDAAHAVDTERLLSEQSDVGRRQLELLRARQIVGGVPASEVLRQQSSLEEIESELDRVRIARFQATRRIAVLLGTTFTEDASFGISGLPTLDGNVACGRPEHILANRPDLRAAMHRVNAANAELAVRMAERWPTIALDAGAAFDAARLSDLFLGEAYSIVGSLTAPLFDAGRRKALVRREEALLRAVVEDAARALLEALGEVESSLVEDQELATAVVHEKEAARLARESWELATSRFLGGGGDAIDAFLAWDRRLEVEREVLDLQREHARARITLEVALGSLLPRAEEDDQ
jgi:NodT family efflux transporter outer membrane factor (OMF) lipoprotein